MRLIHSTKGGAKALRLNKLSTALHHLETVCTDKGDKFVGRSLVALDNLREALDLMAAGSMQHAEELMDETIAILQSP